MRTGRRSPLCLSSSPARGVLFDTSVCGSKVSSEWKSKGTLSERATVPRSNIHPCHKTGSSGGKKPTNRPTNKQTKTHDHCMAGKLMSNFRDIGYWPTRIVALTLEQGLGNMRCVYIYIYKCTNIYAPLCVHVCMYCVHCVHTHMYV